MGTIPGGNQPGLVVDICSITFGEIRWGFELIYVEPSFSMCLNCESRKKHKLTISEQPIRTCCTVLWTICPPFQNSYLEF